MTSLGLHTQTSRLATAAFLLGGPGLILFGLGSSTDPTTTLNIFEFQQPDPSTQPKPYRLIHTLTKYIGIRDIATGLLTVAIWYRGVTAQDPAVTRACNELLGWAMITGSLVPIVDGWNCWLARREGNLKVGAEWTEWKHAFFVPPLLGLGLGLLGAFDRRSLA